MGIGRTIKLSRMVGDANHPSQEYEKTRYPQLVGIARKPLAELTNSALPVRERFSRTGG